MNHSSSSSNSTSSSSSSSAATKRRTIAMRRGHRGSVVGSMFNRSSQKGLDLTQGFDQAFRLSEEKRMLKLDRDQLVETLARAQAEIRVLKASRDGDREALVAHYEEKIKTVEHDTELRAMREQKMRYDERLAREERMRKATKTDKDKELEAEIAHKLNKQITDEREKEREEHVSEKDELKRDLQTAQERIAEMATDKKTMDKRMRVVHSFNTRLTRRVEKNGLDLLNLGRYQALLKLISVKSWAQRWKVFRRVKDLHASFFLVAAMLKHFRALSTRLDGKTRVERDLHLPQSELDVWLIENKRMSKLVNEGLNKVNIAQFLNHIRDLGPIFRTVMHKSWEREQKWRGTAKSFFERNMELTNLNNALKRELAVMSRKYSHTSEMLNSIRKKANINRAAMTAHARVCVYWTGSPGALTEEDVDSTAVFNDDTTDSNNTSNSSDGGNNSADKGFVSDGSKRREMSSHIGSEMKKKAKRQTKKKKYKYSVKDHSRLRLACNARLVNAQSQDKDKIRTRHDNTDYTNDDGDNNSVGDTSINDTADEVSTGGRNLISHNAITEEEREARRGAAVAREREKRDVEEEGEGTVAGKSSITSDDNENREGRLIDPLMAAALSPSPSSSPPSVSVHSPRRSMSVLSPSLSKAPSLGTKARSSSLSVKPRRSMPMLPSSPSSKSLSSKPRASASSASSPSSGFQRDLTSKVDSDKMIRMLRLRLNQTRQDMAILQINYDRLRLKETLRGSVSLPFQNPDDMYGSSRSQHRARTREKERERDKEKELQKLRRRTMSESSIAMKNIGGAGGCSGDSGNSEVHSTLTDVKESSLSCDSVGGDTVAGADCGETSEMLKTSPSSSAVLLSLPFSSADVDSEDGLNTSASSSTSSTSFSTSLASAPASKTVFMLQPNREPEWVKQQRLAQEGTCEQTHSSTHNHIHEYDNAYAYVPRPNKEIEFDLLRAHDQLHTTSPSDYEEDLRVFEDGFRAKHPMIYASLSQTDSRTLESSASPPGQPYLSSERPSMFGDLSTNASPTFGSLSAVARAAAASPLTKLSNPQARRASLALQSFRTFTARDEYEEEDTGATLMYTLQGNIYNSENSKSNHHYGYHQQQQKTRHSLEHPRQQHIQTGGRSDSSRLAGLVSLPPPLPPHASSSSSPSSPFRSPASRRAAKHVITPTRARTNTQTHSYDNRMYTPHRSPTIPLPSYSSSPSAQYSKYYKGSPSDNGASANKLRAGPLLAPLHPVNSHKHSHSTHSKYSHASSPRTNNYGYHTDRTHSRSRYL